MFPLSIACLSGFVSAATSLNIAPQDSIVITSDTTTPSSNPLEMVSPTNQSASWPNNPLPPARAPSLPANISALRALGLDTERPLSWVTAPSGVTLGVQCNVRYGRRLDYQDCLDALGYLPRADERISRFAQRHSGLPHEIALPQRILGSKGKCGIDPELIDPHDSAQASLANVADAANALIERCAPRSGGIAINIGGDNQLAVLLHPYGYATRVRCRGSFVPFSRESCADIEHGMQADDRERVFGSQQLDPTVEEPTPFTLLSTDGNCAIRISSTATSDTESWYHMWEATVALNAVCVRAGSRGTATTLGTHEKLYMEISDHFSSPPSVEVGAGNATTAERI